MQTPDIYAVAPADWVALQQIDALHWARLDRADAGPADAGPADAAPLVELYTPDGELRLGTLHISGHAALTGYFAARFAAEAAKSRITRHFSTNLRMQMLGPDAIQLRSQVCVVSGQGALPLPSQPPSTIADFTDLCQRGADGLWRFARRFAQPLFVGADAPAFATPPPGALP